MARKPTPHTQTWQGFFNHLCNYANLCGWTVKTGEELTDMADSEANLVTIKLLQNKEDQTYVLMHELGHMHIFNSKDYNTKFAGLHAARAKGYYGLQTYRVERVQEELEAWDQGKIVATNLGIPVDQDKFRRMKARNVSSYMIWAQKRKIDSLTEKTHATHTNQNPTPVQ